MEKEEGIIKHSPGDVIPALILIMPGVVVADDTDILILLQHHFTPTEHKTISLFGLVLGSLIIHHPEEELGDTDISCSLPIIHALFGV